MAAAAASEALSGSYIDTHCHVDEVLTKLGVFPPYDAVAAAPQSVFGEMCAGVIAQFCDPAAFSPSFAVYPDLLELPGVYGAFGLHPHHAKYWTEALAERIREALRHPRAVAYGEFGLDFRVNRSKPEAQRVCFAAQLALAQSLEPPLPIVLHCSQAEEEMLALLLEGVAETARPGLTIHLHCYTGGAKHATAFLAAFPRLYIGVTGFVTYGKAKALQDALRTGAVPLARLLLETDGPHMMPDGAAAAASGSGDGGSAASGAVAATACETAEGASCIARDKEEGRASGRGRGRRGKHGRGGRRGGGGPTTPASIPAIAAAVAALIGKSTTQVLEQTRANACTVYGV